MPAINGNKMGLLNHWCFPSIKDDLISKFLPKVTEHNVHGVDEWSMSMEKWPRTQLYETQAIHNSNKRQNWMKMEKRAPNSLVAISLKLRQPFNSAQTTMLCVVTPDKMQIKIM